MSAVTSPLTWRFLSQGEEPEALDVQEEASRVPSLNFINTQAEQETQRRILKCLFLGCFRVRGPIIIYNINALFEGFLGP